jgi:hypothetical protein
LNANEMAASHHASGKILARDLAAYTDAELDQYLQEHTSEGGPAVVEVADPENLSGDFIQRLRWLCLFPERVCILLTMKDRDRAQHGSVATQSRAIDLDQVTARLLQATSSRFASPEPQSPASSGDESRATIPLSPGVNDERRCHAMLVKDGGRPLYPISLLDEVSRDPGAYKDMLRPWLDDPDQDPPDWDRVFEKQAYNWRDFRRWQTYNRSEPSSDITTQYQVMAYESFSRHFRRESLSYTEALGSLLAQYGFTRPFQLQDHAADQDALTTWIEYLGFVCADHYRSARFAKRDQPQQDEAWKDLVDSGVLRPFETREYLDDIENGFRLQSEENRAHEVAELAESAVAAALEKSRKAPNGSRHEHALELDASRSRLDVALKQLESVQRRNSLITNFNSAARSHGRAKEAAQRHFARVQWILDQVPLVEAEMREAKAAEGNSKNPSGKSKTGGEQGVQGRRKRARGQSEDQPAKPPTGAHMPPPAQTRNASKLTRLGNTRDEDVERRAKRVRKDLDGSIVEATPRGRPATSKTTRSRQPAPTPPKSTSSAPKSKQRARPSAVADSGVASRRSRRLIGDQPEFGLLKERRGATPVEEPVQRPSRAVPKSQAPPANVPKTKGTNAASKQARTAHKKRRAK